MYLGSDDQLHTSRSIGSPGYIGFASTLGALGATIELGNSDSEGLDKDDEGTAAEHPGSR